MSRLLVFLCTAVLGFLPRTGLAACASPTGVAGQILYNQSAHVPQYCNGTSWISMALKPGDGGTGALPTTAGLVLHWKLDDGAGVTATDSAGSNNGALSGATWTTGKIGGGADFTNNDISKSGASGLPGLRSALTVSAWFYRTTAPSSYAYVVALRKASSNAQTRLAFNSAGDISVGQYGNSTGLLDPSYIVSANAWHMYTYTYDGTTNRVYIDGVLVGSGTNLPDNAIPDEISLGTDLYQSDPVKFHGRIDDVRIYNRTLTATEIGQLYDYGRLGGGPGCLGPAGVEGTIDFNTQTRRLQYCEGDVWASMGTCGEDPERSKIVHWMFDEGSGTTAFDSVGTNHGTLTNGPAWTSGMIGGAIDFDSNDDAIPVTGVAANRSQATFTAWVNSRTAITSDWQVIYDESNTGNCGDNIFGMHLWDGNTGTPGTGVRFKVNGGEVVADNVVLSDNTWYFIAGVFNSDTDMQAVYINGIPYWSYNPQPPISGIPVNAAIGNSGWWTCQTTAFNGQIDDVRIYGRALNTADILALYNQGKYRMLDNGRIAHWPLDETGGRTVRDLVGGYTGTWAFGLTNNPVTGVVGKAMQTGWARYIDVGAIPQLDGATKATLSAWMKRSVAGQSEFVGRGEGYGGDIFAITYQADGNVRFYLPDASWDAIWDYGSYTVNDTRWHHLTMVFDGTQTGNANRLKGYVDGQPVTLVYSDTVSSYVTSSLQPFNIGSQGPGYGSSDVIYIDDVRLYNRALSAADVAALYESQIPGNACSVAGQLAYDSTKSRMTYCDGALWRGIGDCTGNVPDVTAHWKFDDGSGTTAADSSGNGYAGTLTNGPVWASGALTFDGTNDYVAVPASSSLDNLSALTVSAWINPDTVDKSARIVTKSTECCLNMPAGGWRFITRDTPSTSTNSLNFAVDYSGTDLVAEKGNSLVAGQWQHVVVTWDGTPRVAGVRLYINGEAVKSDSNLQEPVGTRADDSATAIGIGGRASGLNPSDWFDGTMDDVRIYNRVLSPEEVRNLYRKGR